MNGPSGKAPVAPKVGVDAFAFSLVPPGSTKSTQNNNNDKHPKTIRKSANILKLLSLCLVETFRRDNPKFEYSPSFNPRRVLTHPAEGVSNSNFDNCNADYILYVNDIIGSTPNHRYQVVDLLGQGTFGQVVKCRNCDTDEVTALKILKNKPAYLNQGLVEIRILELLNQHYDSENKHHIARLVDYFIFRRHLCLVFELLSVNLYELIKQNHFRGLSTNLIRVFMIQLLDALVVLTQANIIHCDLKPENILLQMLNSPSIKLIDFGSACFESQTVYSYIQSRHYRSPEVLIGTRYTAGIDMWSLGCIAAELFLGLPLFPGTSEYNQLARIIEMQGYPPDYMLDSGKQTHKFFDQAPDPPPGGPKYVLKSEKAYAEESGVNIAPAKRYFNYTKLEDLVQNYGFKKYPTSAETEKERHNRAMFCDFVSGLVKIDPKERWTPLQAKEHPFITGENYKGPFVPNPALRKPPPLKAIPPRLPLNPSAPFHPMSAPAAAASMFPPPPSHTVGSAKKNMYKPGPSEYVASPESYSPRGFFTHMMQQQGSNMSLGASPSVSHFGPPSPYSSYNPYHLHGPPMAIPASPSFSAWPEAGGAYPANYSLPHQPSPNSNPNRRARSKSDSKELPHMAPQHDYRKRGDSSVASTPTVRGPMIGESPAASHFMFPVGSLTSPRGEKGSSTSTTPSTPSSMGRGGRHHDSQSWTPNRVRSRSFGNDNHSHPPHSQYDTRQQPQSHSPRRLQQQAQQAPHSPERLYSSSPSDDDPSNWDPNYSDEQLLYGYDTTTTTNVSITNAIPPKRHSPAQQHSPQTTQQQQQQQQYYQQQPQQHQQMHNQFSNWGQQPAHPTHSQFDSRQQPPSPAMDEANTLYGNFSNLYIDANLQRRGGGGGPPTYNNNNSTTTTTTTSNNNNNHNIPNPTNPIPNNNNNTNTNTTVGSASVASSWAQNSWTVPTMPPDSYSSSYDLRGDSSSTLLGFSPYVHENHPPQYSHSPPTSSSASSSSFSTYMQQQHSTKYGRSPPKQASHKNPHRQNNPGKQQQASHSPPSKSAAPIHHQQQHHQQQHHNKQQTQQYTPQQPQQQQPHYSHQAMRTPPRPPNVIFSSPSTPHQQITTPVLPSAQAIFGSHLTPSNPSSSHHLSPFIDRASGIPKSPDATSPLSDDRNTTHDVFTPLFVADLDENEEHHDSPAHHIPPFGTASTT